MNSVSQVSTEAAGSIGAFFDLDGTLLASPSLEWRFIEFLAARDEITSRHGLRWLGNWGKALWRNPRAATSENKSYLAGLRTPLVSDWAASLAAESLEPFERGVVRILWHFAQQHQVFIVSGTLAPLARVFAKGISEKIEVIASELETSSGFWTGRLASAHMSGGNKRFAIEAIAASRGLRLNVSFAYGNEMADFAMLNRVGHPTAVNPTLRLRRTAARRNWSICDWSKSNGTRAAWRRWSVAKEA